MLAKLDNEHQEQLKREKEQHESKLKDLQTEIEKLHEDLSDMKSKARQEKNRVKAEFEREREEMEEQFDKERNEWRTRMNMIASVSRIALKINLKTNHNYQQQQHQLDGMLLLTVKFKLSSASPNYSPRYSMTNTNKVS